MSLLNYVYGRDRGRVRKNRKKRMHVCSVCGYSSDQGVWTYRHALRPQKVFVCLRCFWNPYLFFLGRRILGAHKAHIPRRFKKDSFRWDQRDIARYR